MRLLIVLALCLGLGAATAQAFSNEPSGFGPLRFGMSAAAVEKALPAVKRKGTEEFLTISTAENQSVLGLKPCHVELNFVDDKLYEISFRCEPKNKVAAKLEKQFGAPNQHGPGATVWLSEARTVTLNPQSTVFTFADRPLSIVAQRKLLTYVLTHQAQAQPTAAPSPPPTP